MADVDTSWLTQLMPGQGANPLDTLMQMKDLQYRDAMIGSTQALEQYRQLQAQSEMQDMQAEQMFGQMVQQSVNPETGEMNYNELISNVASNPMTAKIFPDLAEQLVNMRKTSYETITERLGIDKLKAETTGREFQQLLTYGDAVTKDQVGQAWQNAWINLQESGALEDSDMSQIIDELISIEGMNGQQLAQYVQSNVSGAMSAQQALDLSIGGTASPEQREHDWAKQALIARGYEDADAEFMATQFAAGAITMELDNNGRLQAWDNLTGQVLNVPQPRRMLSGDIAEDPTLGPGNVPMAPGMTFGQQGAVPVGSPAAEAAVQPPAPSQGQFMPTYEEPIEDDSAGVIFGGIDSGAFYNIPEEEYSFAKDYIQQQPRVGQGLWADTGDATGLSNWWTDFMTRTVGQTGLEWPTEAGDLEVVAIRQAFNMAQRTYTRAAALSDRWAVGEQNIIADETNFAPSWIDSPEALRARMIAISQNMKVRLVNVLRDAQDPYLPDDVSAEAREGADNIARLLALLNVPDDATPADAAFENSQTFGGAEPRGDMGGQDSASWAQKYKDMGGDPSRLDAIYQDLLNGRR